MIMTMLFIDDCVDIDDGDVSSSNVDSRFLYEGENDLEFYGESEMIMMIMVIPYSEESINPSLF